MHGYITWMADKSACGVVFVAFDRALVTTGNERGEEIHPAKAIAVETCQQTGSDRQCEAKPKPKESVLHRHHCPSEAR